MRITDKERKFTDVNSYLNRLLRAITSRVSKRQVETTRFLNVVERSLYSEWSRDYPINEKKALKKAIKLEQASFDGVMLRKLDGTGFTALFWKFRSEVDTSRFGFLIPESILLANLLERNEATSFLGNDGELFIANDNGRIHSALKTKLVTSVADFAAGLGVSHIGPSREKEESYTQAILKSPAMLASFVNWGKQPQVSWFRLLIPSAIIVCLYLAISSIYLTSSIDKVESNYRQQQTELKTALAIQENYRSSLEKLSVLEALNTELDTSFPIWLVINVLYKVEGVSVRRITMVEDSLYEVFGRAERATDVLRIVNGMTGVEASFNRPVTNRRDGEVFSLELRIDNNRLIKNFSAENVEQEPNVNE